MLLNEILEEASTPRRAWEGKLKKIDKLLAWMYDKDILTKGEKAKKDSIFRAYYRYYNDGDLPAALKLQGMNKYSLSTEKETALEKYLEDFIKMILAKYLPKVDRAEFQLDDIIDSLKTPIDVSESYDAHSLLTYWIKKVKVSDDTELKGMLEDVQAKYDALKTAANEASPKSLNTTMSYRVEKMKEEGTWNKQLDKQWDALKASMDPVTAFLKNLLASAKDLKKSKFGTAE